MDIVNIIGQTDHVISLAKRIHTALKKAEYSEVLIWMSDLQEQILDLKNSLVEVRSENIKLREHIQQLEAQLSKKKKWHHDGMRYWAIDEKGNILKEQGAYCPTCLDKNKDEIRLLKLSNGYYSCNVCKHTYGKWKDEDD